MPSGPDPAALQENYRRVLWVLFLTMAGNLAAAGLKLVYGALTGSLALLADGIHSGFDAFNNVVGIVSVTVARRPADENHLYGHQKFELLAATGIAGLILLTAWEVGRRAAERLLGPAAPPGAPASILAHGTGGLAVIGATFVLNLAVATYERRKARELASPFLLADSAHTFSDLAVTLSVFASFLLLKLGHPIWDPVVSLLVAVYLAGIALGLLRRNVLFLSDVVIVDPNVVEPEVLAVPGVISCHKVRTRGIPGYVFVDLHIQIDPEATTRDGHAIVHAVVDRLKSRLEGVRDVLIHTEPYNPEAHGPPRGTEIPARYRAAGGEAKR